MWIQNLDQKYFLGGWVSLVQALTRNRNWKVDKMSCCLSWSWLVLGTFSKHASLGHSQLNLSFEPLVSHITLVSILQQLYLLPYQTKRFIRQEPQRKEQTCSALGNHTLQINNEKLLKLFSLRKHRTSTIC